MKVTNLSDIHFKIDWLVDSIMGIIHLIEDEGFTTEFTLHNNIMTIGIYNHYKIGEREFLVKPEFGTGQIGQYRFQSWIGTQEFYQEFLERCKEVGETYGLEVRPSQQSNKYLHSTICISDVPNVSHDFLMRRRNDYHKLKNIKGFDEFKFKPLFSKQS